MKKRHSEEQIIRILREAETKATPIRDVCKQHNISEQTFYRWRDKYGGMEVADARRLKELEAGDGRLDIGCIAAHGHFSFDGATKTYNLINENKPATAFLFKLIAQLQFSGTAP